MKNILFIFFITFVLTARSQTTDSVVYNKFDLGFTFSPDLCYRVLKTDDAHSWIKNSYDTIEVFKYGYTSGLNISIQLNKKLHLSSGFLFSDKGERTKKYSLQPVVNYINHFYYLDIPLTLSYYPGNKKYFFSKPKKTNFYLTAGISTNIYLSSRSVTSTNSSEEEESLSQPFDLSRINFSMILGCGLSTPITNKWYFKLEPIYRRSLNSIMDAPVKKYLFSFGLNIGLFSKF